MTGGTLVISREVNNHDHFKKRFEALGFRDVTVADCESDALNFKIRDLKPGLVIMGARFHDCCTPYLMGELHKIFPKIRLAAVIIGHYPENLAAEFIANGVTSYVTSFDGVGQFYKGLDEIAKGGEYISPAVRERINLRDEFPKPAGNITDRYLQVIRLICCGYQDTEIAGAMRVVRGSVHNYKTKIYSILNIRNAVELIRAALTLKLIKLEELYFYPGNYPLSPHSEILLRKKRKQRAKRNEQLAMSNEHGVMRNKQRLDRLGGFYDCKN